MRTTMLVFLILGIFDTANAQKIIFLHHSTGEGVYSEGNVHQWFTNYNSAHTTNYHITERSYPTTPYPWDNYPYDYWNLWVNNACTADAGKECMQSLVQNYQVIIFKHCFPGAAIQLDDPTPSVSSAHKTLANYKLQYRALRALMDNFPDTKFIVWTLAPLHRNATNTVEASRARQFVSWVKTSWLTEDGMAHPNIFVFDFYGLTAESDPNTVNGQVNCLKYDYEQNHSGNDSHPNTLANQTVGPLFCQFIVDTIQSSQSSSVSVPVFRPFGLIGMICGFLLLGILGIAQFKLSDHS
jgi:hypothetical protein